MADQRRTRQAPDRFYSASPIGPETDHPVQSAIALLLPLAVYLTTASRHPGWGDSTELVLAARSLSIPHPTGYPLYLLLAHAASLLPFGEPPFKVALVSSVAVAGSVWMLFRILLHLTGRPTACVLAALAFAFFKEPWEQAVVPEVYGLHLLLSHAVLLCVVRTLRYPTGRELALLSFLGGLSFANHMLTVFLVPASVLALCLEPRARALLMDRRRILGLLVIGAVPVTLYLALWIRARSGPLFDEGGVSSLGGLLAHVTGRQFSYRMFGQARTDRFTRELTRLVRESSVQPSPWWTLSLGHALLAGLGFFKLKARKPVLALFSTVAGLDLGYTFGYDIPDKGAYYLPLYGVAAVLLGLGLARAAERLERDGRPGLGRVGLLVVLLPLVSNGGIVDRSHDRSLSDYAEDLAKLCPPRSLVVTDDLTLWWGLIYDQLERGLHRDRFFLNTYSLRLPWFLPFLGRIYPSLGLPPGIDRELNVGLARIAREGDPGGSLSQRLVEELANRIVDGALDQRPVRLVIHATSEDLKRWGSFHLRSHGLVYEPSRDPIAPVPYPTDYADPALHRVGSVHGIEAVRVAKRYSTANNRLGIQLIAAGRLELAEQAFLRALDYEPDYPQVHLNLGVLYAERLRKPELAYRVYRRFLELTPDDPQSGAVKRWLGQYQHELVRQGR